jgi:predicted acylesterase/phospholipase RssA
VAYTRARAREEGARTLSEARCDELDFSARTRFQEILPAEYAEIHKRRAVQGQTAQQGRPRRLTGISLSGGEAPGATFSLGLLQALHDYGIPPKFDYLSTVSGGGYCGGWWSAWLAREERVPGDIFPPGEEIAFDATYTRWRRGPAQYRGL